MKVTLTHPVMLFFSADRTAPIGRIDNARHGAVPRLSHSDLEDAMGCRIAPQHAPAARIAHHARTAAEMAWLRWHRNTPLTMFDRVRTHQPHWPVIEGGFPQQQRVAGQGAPVDVLAVLDAQQVAAFERDDTDAARSIGHARVGGAELMRASRFFEDESRRKYGDNVTGGARLRVALARVGGEA